MIDFAQPKDTEEIRKLWDIAFPEEPLFNDWFFENYFKAENCLVLKKEGKISAMAQLLPYEIQGAGKVSYIYGAATDPSYRRQGLMRRLLEKSFELDKQRGAVASILIPQNKELFDFYRRLGYETRFFVNIKGTEPCKTEGYTLKSADCEDIPFMDKLYRESQTDYIIRDCNYWVTQIEMFKALDGDCYILLRDNKPVAYGFYTDNYIQEGMGEVNTLAYLAGADKYVSLADKNNTPIGMAYPYGDFPQRLYLNLMFN